MRAFGNDRIEVEPEGRVALVCRQPKDWKPRLKAPRHDRVDHPGTAILWEDEHWEVLSIERRAGQGIRYVLAPWDPVHVFRVMDRYDEEAEAERVERRRRELRAAEHRGVLLLLAPLAGLLPEEDQLALDYRLGVPATRMTFLSALILFLFGAWAVIMLIASGLSGGAGIPTGVLLVGSYLFVESFGRLVVVMSQSRPIGSLMALPWLVVKAFREPAAPSITRAPDERDREEERRHTFHVLQPLLSLIPATDQRLLMERYAFDAISWGRTTAWILSGVGFLLAASAALNFIAGMRSPGELLWLSLGLLVIAEQRGRLARLRTGEPAGSFLGYLVRGMARELVAPGAPRRPRAEI